MKKSVFRLMICSCLLGALMAMTALGQDFQRSYNIGAGGAVSVRNVSGDVKVAGYDGNAIVVTAYKEGRDKDQISVEDRSSGNNVDVRVDYPKECDCNASIRFEVKVPRGIQFKFDAFSSVSGDVEVRNISGELRAKSVSGEVKVSGVIGAVNASSVSGEVHVGEINGTVSAKSVSGSVAVEIRQLSGAGNMDFSSVSGEVRVKVPANLDADVQMSTFSGDLRTDFPLTIEESKWKTGRKASGRVGGGSRTLKISSTSGGISLLHF